ncbi:uncharacterized protein LOC131676450 [Topomyia yanbarensis]|uniref:uncharacterized protein LOC131676450 n=1 Tax=Topomyia yanbarensis TaxID=2498891 RepID=UPI00273C9AE2|nr:uncharacterized protein LOC131676450 [Topomyia yanbarensis]
MTVLSSYNILFYLSIIFPTSYMLWWSRHIPGDIFSTPDYRHSKSNHLHDSGFGEVDETETKISVNIHKAPYQTRQRTVRYAGDVKDDLTPEEALVAVPKLKAQLSRTRSNLRKLRSQNKLLRDRLSSMQSLVDNLHSRKMISDVASSLISQNYASNHFLLDELKSRTEGQPYSDALRSFARTLHFYSPKAYKYVRKVFNNTLPHPRTIIRWYESVSGEPGVTKESLDALKLKAAEMASNGKPLLGSLMMDEMAIRQQVLWNEQTRKLEGVPQLHSVHGTTGTAPSSVEQIPAAKEALVFMVTGIQAPWKIPVAYFLIKGLNSTEKKNIINIILESVHEAGVCIIALTFDGTCTNIATVNALGCEIRGDYMPLKTCFQHPSSNHEVHVLLDPVHMLKLVRNTLYKQKQLLTPNGIVK